jgi:hypothetical protein
MDSTFENYTKSRTTGVYRLLVLNGHKSHHSAEFEVYCQEHSIITLYMPAYSSYILQPLEVGCFSPLKQAYDWQIKEIIRAQITHISKDDFFPAFHAVFDIAMTKSNIQGGFRGTRLFPFDPKRVISILNLKLKTPTPPNSRPSTA